MYKYSCLPSAIWVGFGGSGGFGGLGGSGGGTCDVAVLALSFFKSELSENQLQLITCSYYKAYCTNNLLTCN